MTFRQRFLALLAAVVLVASPTVLWASPVEAATWCTTSVGPNVSSARCTGNFTSFRVYHYCSDGTWKYGGWKAPGQTSSAYCPLFFQGTQGRTYI
jgi:hypothetical protein